MPAALPIRALLFSGLIALLFTPPANAGRLKGERSLNNTPYGYKITKEIARAGKKSQRFEVRPGDCARERNKDWDDCKNDRERSEFSLDKRIRPGQDVWIGYSLYLPKDFYSSPRVKTTLGQIHQKGGPASRAAGLPSFPPLLQIDAIGDKLRACTHILSGPATNAQDKCDYAVLGKVSKMRGKWTDIQIHLRPQKEQPLLEIYVNGERRASNSNFMRFVPKNYYFKYGIYRSFVSRQGAPMPTQIAYFDEIRIGKSRAKVVITGNRPVD